MTFLSEDVNDKIDAEVSRLKDIRGRIYFLFWLVANAVGMFLVLGFAQRLRDQNYTVGSEPLVDAWNDWNLMVATLVVTFTLSLISVFLLVRLNTQRGEKSIRHSVTGEVIANLEDEDVSEKAKRLVQLTEAGELIYPSHYDDDETINELYSKTRN